MIKGIDVSHYQLKIDWTKIPKDIEFAIMKCTEGLAVADARFAEYKAGARKAGLGIGYYHFARGLDPVKEAEFFVKSVGDIAEGELLALDFEIKIADPVGFCNKFVKRVIELVGFTPLFYSYSSIVSGSDWGDVYNCGLWIADPSSAPRIGKWKTWAVWQYTISPKGAQKYTTEAVDQDYFNGTIEVFKKYGKQLTTEAPMAKELLNALEEVLDVDYGDNLDPKDQIDASKKLIAYKNAVEETLAKAKITIDGKDKTIAEYVIGVSQFQEAITKKDAMLKTQAEQLAQLGEQQAVGLSAIGTIKLFQEAFKSLINFK
jgi:GH25 family lysozyme M1 (1,4-beta-N-acetylmuramidase)